MKLIVRKACIAIGVTIPVRGSATVDFNDTAAKTILNGTLPQDNLAQVFELSLIGANTASTKRASFVADFMIVRRSAESPNAYSVDQSTLSIMNNEASDLEFNIVENGDTGYQVQVTDVSGAEGVYDWKHSLKLKESITL